MVQRTVSQEVLAQACPGVSLGAQLGEGGNARVFAGTSPLHGDVAVKFLLNTSGKRLARFQDEVKVVTTHLNGSPYVLPILESNVSPEPGGIAWYVMPAAVSLKKALAGQSLHDRLGVLVQLAEGLAAMHKAKVSHRDIKPENMLVWQGKYVFADFGLADFEDSAGVTEQNERMGPLFYIAPEMLNDPSTADPFLADVYSFAKAMWVILTDKKFPFQGQYNAEGPFGLYQFENEGKRPVFEPFERLLRQATDDEPSARPTAEQMLVELRQAVAVQGDFARENAAQWDAAERAALTNDGLTSATWRGAESISQVFTALSRRDGLNHLFHPGGGGTTIESASSCEGGAMLCLKVQAGGIIVVKPDRLTLHRFPGRPELNIAVLNTLDIQRLGDGGNHDDWSEELLRLDDFDYLVPNDDEENPLPREVEVQHCSRFFKGGEFTLTPTGGLFNDVDDYGGSNASKSRAYVAEVQRRLELERQGPAKPVHTERYPRALRSSERRAVPFALKHIDDGLLYKLLLADEAMRSKYHDSTGTIVNSGDPAVFERLMRGPSEQRKQSLALLKGMSREQQGEYMALVGIGRGDVPPSDLQETAEYHAKSHHHLHYLAEKLGNGYLEKAVKRFGLHITVSQSEPAPPSALPLKP